MDYEKAIEEWWKDHTKAQHEPLLVRQIRAVGLTGEQTLAVLEVIGRICRDCLDREWPCACTWNE